MYFLFHFFLPVGSWYYAWPCNLSTTQPTNISLFVPIQSWNTHKDRKQSGGHHIINECARVYWNYKISLTTENWKIDVQLPIDKLLTPRSCPNVKEKLSRCMSWRQTADWRYRSTHFNSGANWRGGRLARCSKQLPVHSEQEAGWALQSIWELPKRTKSPHRGVNWTTNSRNVQPVS